MILCDLTTCYSIEHAWFQRLKVKCDEPLSEFAFKIKLRRYNMGAATALYSTTDFRLVGGRFVGDAAAILKVGRPVQVETNVESAWN